MFYPDLIPLILHILSTGVQACSVSFYSCFIYLVFILYFIIVIVYVAKHFCLKCAL